MEKKFINKEIHNETSSKSPIPVGSDILLKIRTGVIIQAGWEEPFYSENNSSEGYFYFKIFEKRLETDKEFESRKMEFELQKEDYKEKRRKRYLELKKEFEDE